MPPTSRVIQRGLELPEEGTELVLHRAERRSQLRSERAARDVARDQVEQSLLGRRDVEVLADRARRVDELCMR
jgi:hypothetical protein